ncbi:uncharacterized protein LOC115796800 [Archocentrus centrarchus]|uniref:uncharacterized protein LOC115796800 n=1 Tax=Archocentrus centrarchus TaxID=63155 RepID=UPI0011E9F8D9|nr:uncharacterized protein LOC115796800 [Archocentrus centrarchus]
MAALKFSWPCWTLGLAVVAVTGSTFAAQRVFTRHTGMNLTLEFQAPAGSDHVRLVRLGSDKYIFYCRDGHPIHPKDQEESFKGRVEGTDCDKINGTVTIPLLNLTSSDSGAYEFHGVDSDGRRFSETIILNVTDPDERRSFTALPTTNRKVITAESGQTVTLPCQAPNNNNIMAVEWSRADLETQYVLLYRDGQFIPDDQHPSFKNRVDLQDRQMKDGDVSLILKDVMTDDTGTYECRIFTRGTNSTKRAIFDGDPISLVHLRVVGPPGGHTEDGSAGLRAGLQLPAMVIVAVVGFFLYRKHKKRKRPGSYSHV